MPKEIIIYCDESVQKGKFYSNFYGGALITSDHIDEVRKCIADKMLQLNLGSEVKWTKITENYCEKYIELIDTFFNMVAVGKIKLRVMFRQNLHEAVGLSDQHLEDQFFILYYQFIKHAFGLKFVRPRPGKTRLRLYLDQLPDTREKAEKFRGYVAALGANRAFVDAGLTIDKQDIADIESHSHPILQCLDVVLGSMQFRLNNLHKEKPEGARKRGKRTIAKEKVYNHINRRIRQIYLNFNIGISTGVRDNPANVWRDVYRHWLFIPSDFRIVGEGKHKRRPRHD
ncbi:DUF3800 domain-containing protein [Acetobacteraceae bacterium KSS8]|uniref:DUF3800 domain-containing protein n=1 Tax=Endosaccharibacter trunci TaxID=2812733 RepID=A0ABT1WAL0_9PROT|nr:DUF3800 domain-containing protein [Acetobacteraceae bacterium KSS8]